MEGLFPATRATITLRFWRSKTVKATPCTLLSRTILASNWLRFWGQCDSLVVASFQPSLWPIGRWLQQPHVLTIGYREREGPGPRLGLCD